MVTDSRDGARDGQSIRALTVAAGGYLNPHIFRPEWFRRHGILTESEVKEAGPLLANEEGLIAFATDYLTLEVTPTRLIIRTDNPEMFSRLGRIIEDTFLILKHTPIDSIALNWECHQPFTGSHAVEEFIDVYAPRSVWRPIEVEPEERRVLLSGPRPDHLDGSWQIELSKSDELTDAVYLGFIDDVQASEDYDEGEGCLQLISDLVRLWPQSESRADKLFSDFFGDI